MGQYNQQIFTYNRNASFQMYILMALSKFNSLPQVDVQNLISRRSNNLLVEDVTIANPNNPAVSLNCKLICYSII